MEMKIVHTYLDLQVEGEIMLFGTDEAQEDKWGFKYASIWDLRHDLDRQKRLVELGHHPDGYAIPWDENLVMVAEGLHKWCPMLGDWRKVDNEFYILEDLVHGGTWISDDMKMVVKYIHEYIVGDAEYSIKRITAETARERGFNV